MAICIGLRLPLRGEEEQLAARIEDALARDDELCAPERPLGRLLAAVRQMPGGSEQARSVLAKKYRLAELRSVCKILRLTTVGAKYELACRIVEESRSRAAAVEAPEAAVSVEAFPVEDDGCSIAATSAGPASAPPIGATGAGQRFTDDSVAAVAVASPLATPEYSFEEPVNGDCESPPAAATAAFVDDDEEEEEEEEDQALAMHRRRSGKASPPPFGSYPEVEAYLRPRAHRSSEEEREARRSRSHLRRRQRLAELLVEELSQTPYAAVARAAAQAMADIYVEGDAQPYRATCVQPYGQAQPQSIHDSENFFRCEEPMTVNV